MLQDNQTIAYKTTVQLDEQGRKVIVYYETSIVCFDDAEILLNTGNWWSRSTAQRMNLVSRHFKLGYRVFRKGKQWYVEYQDQKHEFDAIEIKLNRSTGAVTPLK